MGSTPDGSVVVVDDEDIKLPPRTAVSGRCRLVTKREMRKGVFQLAPAKYSPEKEEVALCETVVEAAEIVPIMVTNQANKAIKIKKGEEVGKVLPLRSIHWVKFDKVGKKGPE